MSNDVKNFFNDYSSSFNAIYGTKNNIIQCIINKLFRESMQVRFNKVMQYCYPLAGKTILDAGCGPGIYSITLAKNGASKVTGVDFSGKMIAIAKSNATDAGVIYKCDFINRDIMDFDPNRKFNYTVVMGVMDYVSNQKEFIQHLIKLTKDRIFLSFPIKNGILAAQRKFRYRCRKKCPLYMISEQSLNNLLGETTTADFKIEKISRDFFVTIYCN